MRIKYEQIGICPKDWRSERKGTEKKKRRIKAGTKTTIGKPGSNSERIAR